MNTIVSVYLIDSGKLVTSCRDSELLHLEDEFRSFPPQAVQIRIANCVPCDLDSEWDTSIVDIVQRWLEEAILGQNVHVEGRIELSAMNTLWLDTLRVVEQLPGISMPAVQIMSVYRNLLNKKFAIVDNKALLKLSSLAMAAGIWKDTPDVVSPPNVNEAEKLLPNEMESVSLVVPKTAASPQQRGRRHRGENLLSRSISSCSLSSPLSSVSYRPVADLSIKSSTKTQHVCKEHIWAELYSDEYQEVYVSTYFSPRLFYVQKYSDR